MVYFFTRPRDSSDEDKQDRQAGYKDKMLAAMALMVISFTLLYGAYIGGSDRIKSEEEFKDLEQWYKKELIQTETEFEIYKQERLNELKGDTLTSAR